MKSLYNHIEKMVNILSAIFLVAALLCTAALGIYFFFCAQQKSEFNTIRKEFWHPEETIEPLTGEPLDSIPDVCPDFPELARQNPDFAGWIRVPGSNIDYPVMHTPQQPQYYLRRDFKQRYSRAGTPFLDERCLLEPTSSNLIVYGHNMKDGSMFSDLLNYQSPEYCSTNPWLHFYIPTEKRFYRIIAVVQVQIDTNEAYELYSFVNESNTVAANDYAQKVRALSLFPIERGAASGNCFLTLSTCSNYSENERILVIGILEKTEGLQEKMKK